MQTFAALEAQLPWVLGAFGTVGLDVFIARQVCVCVCVCVCVYVRTMCVYT